MPLHKEILIGENHIIHNYEYADETARLAASGFLPTDVDKLAKQIDTSVFWRLSNHLPITWVEFGATDSGSSENTGIVLVSGSSAVTYATITLALAAASSGDTVMVGNANYAESISIPSGVTVLGSYSSDSAAITGSDTTSIRVTLAAGAKLRNVTVYSPSSGPNPAIDVNFASGNPFAAIESVIFIGGGGTGPAIRKQGTGGVNIQRSFVGGGSMSAVFDMSNGDGFINELFALAGTADDFIKVSGGSLRASSITIEGSATITDGIDVGGTGKVFMVSSSLSGATNVIHIASSICEFEALSCTFVGDTWDLLVDPAVTSTIECHIHNVEMSTARMSASTGFLQSANFVLNILDERIDDPSQKLLMELNVGSPERPQETVLGEGDSYTDGMLVYSTDNTATSTSDGSTFVDESITARTPTGSTFTFQGTSANHTILVGTERANSDDLLKHWGWKVKITTAGSTNGVYVFEIWDGAAWVETDSMSTGSGTFFVYGNRSFIRANSSEHIRFGITPSTTWVKKTINSVNAFWVRVRITSAPTVAPVFEQFKMHSNRFEANGSGFNTYHGGARFRTTIPISGNVWGEGGATVNTNIAVGSGGAPTGWNHTLKNSLMNGQGDAVETQTPIPKGTDTSMPINVSALLSASTTGIATTPPSMIFSFLPIEVIGNIVADPSGGIPPVARSEANTETFTSKPASTITKDFITSVKTKLYRLDFGSFSIADYFEGDQLLMRLELDDDGSDNTNVAIMSLEVSGASWANGELLS